VVCVPGFADSTASWQPLCAALIEAPFDVMVLDLPGFGMTPPGRHPASIPYFAELVARLVRRECRDQVTLVGHSLGAVVAVDAANQLAGQCSGLVSFEGNLTPEDAYFSGQAADYRDPSEFKRAFSTQVDQMAAAGRVPSSYADAVKTADAETMWTLGREARVRGADGSFGAAYRNLPMRTVYFWASSTTPPTTRQYLARHAITEHQLPIEHHWPWTLDPDVVAQALTEFINGKTTRHSPPSTTCWTASTPPRWLGT
jgi:pimeloyl-ACP methyl ester carboxylesterase